MKTHKENTKAFQAYSSSTITDYLPSTLIDELDFSSPRTTLSSVVSVKEGKTELLTPHSSQTTVNTIGNIPQVYNDEIKKNYSQDVPYFFKSFNKTQSNQNLVNTIRPIPRAVYSDNVKKLYQANVLNSSVNINKKNPYAKFQIMIPPQPQPQQNQFFQVYPSFQNQKNSNNFEGQLDALSGIMSLKLILDSFPTETILSMIKSSKGSRHLQKIICSSPPNQYETDRLVTLIAPMATEMMCDYYGNYFLQKFIPYFSLKHRLTFYQFIQPNFMQIANNICGNHSLQSLIGLQNSKEEELIIKSSVENYIPQMAFGANSSHVIAKIISSVKECNRSYINCYVINNLIYLALDSNGICIVKSFIAGLEHESYIGSVIFQFSTEVTKLTYDQYGNFGIQEVINKFGLKYASNIIYPIVHNLVPFAISKFSSNVIDCILKYFNKTNLKFFSQILKKIFFEENNLSEMIKNKYATYVIENCLKLVFENKSPELMEIKVKIFNHLMSKPIINDKKQIMEILKNFIVNHSDCSAK